MPLPVSLNQQIKCLTAYNRVRAQELYAPPRAAKQQMRKKTTNTLKLLLQPQATQTS